MANRKSEPLERKPPVEFTPERRALFLELYRSDPVIGGRKMLCAERVGISKTALAAHEKKDLGFQAAVAEAKNAWVEEILVTAAIKRATEGVAKPIMGGRFKDEVVATEIQYSDTLLMALLRANDPAFKDKGGAGADGGTGGGVVVLPSAPATMGDWQKQFGEMAKGGGAQDD